MASIITTSIEQVCEFLRTRGVNEDVIKNFEKEKMDAEVICNSTNLELKQMGLDALGDILSLRKFATGLCKKGEPESKSTNEKRRLLEALLTKSGPKRKSNDSEGEKAAKKPRDSTIISPKPRKVIIGWLHFNSERQHYVPVRVAKGGGSRQVELRLSSNKDDIINIGKDLFFPDGYSGYGPSDKMSFGIANYQQRDISEVKVNGVKLPFTLQRYIEDSKLSRVRLYLTSKMNEDENEESTIEEGDSSTFKFNCELQDHIWGLSDDDEPNESENRRELNSTLEQESLKERRPIIWQQDEEYNESLAADKAKTENAKAVLEAEIELAKRQELIRRSRSSRVPPEPTDKEDIVMIQVCHIKQGRIKRAFKAQERVARIYDWVGSLSAEPEYFQLTDFSHNAVNPTQKACEIKSVLYMEESSSSSQVAVVPEKPTIGESVEREIDQIGSMPPAKLLEDDASGNSSCGEAEVEVEDQIVQDEVSCFKQIRESAVELLNGGELEERMVVLQRRNLVSTIMHLYSDNEEVDVTEQHLRFDFKDEMASDFGGVSREVYSSFWNEISSLFLEGNESSFVPRCGGITKERYVTLGKVIHHGFILTGIFPVCLNQAYIQAMLIGEDSPSDEMLLQEFIHFLGPYEGCMLSGILGSPTFTADDREFVIELEARYGMRCAPSASTLKTIVFQMARSELINAPMHTMAKLKQGMMCNEQGRLLWQSISAEDIDDIYRSQTPTPEKVSSLLISEEEFLSEDKAKVFEYLSRYVKSADAKKCQAFLKYCTGSNTIVVDKIKVTFFKSTAREPLPRAHTCGAVVEIPLACYPTYNFFKTILDSLLDNPLAFLFRFG